MVAATACSTDDTLDEERRVDLRQPMRFGTSFAQSAEKTVVTRATPLEGTHQTFKVGTWKAFGLATQQTVMDGYEVDYTETMITDYGDGYNWYYEGLNGQPLRYWDLSAYPYEFRAVSPYIDGATITADGLTINASFKSQQIINNITTEGNEPCVVANVCRVKDGTNYEDTDKIKNAKINEAGKADATREVHMPFHHLMAKVGFKIYIDNPMPLHEAYEIYIKDIKISVVNSDGNFITASNSYTATSAQGLGRGTFGINTTATGEHMLLEHDEDYPYKEVRDNVEQNVNFHYHLNKDNAFDLAPECLLQIPQTGVKLRVRMEMETRGVEAYNEDFEYDTLLSLDPANTAGDTFTWEPEKKYIYYLHVPNLHGHEIYLHTCEILPWDEVQTTDIGVGL